MPAPTVNSMLLQQWLVQPTAIKSIEAELVKQGFDAEQIDLHLKEYNRLKLARRQWTGFIWMATGAFLGFISCVLTLVNPVPSLYEVILYGLTSVAIIIIFVGLYLVFES